MSTIGKRCKRNLENIRKIYYYLLNKTGYPRDAFIKVQLIKSKKIDDLVEKLVNAKTLEEFREIKEELMNSSPVFDFDIYYETLEDTVVDVDILKSQINILSQYNNKLIDITSLSSLAHLCRTPIDLILSKYCLNWQYYVMPINGVLDENVSCFMGLAQYFENLEYIV